MSHVTMQDIARQAKVSIKTVSRVVNGDRDVSEKTRREIQNLISRYDYQPNSLARALSAIRAKSLVYMWASPSGDYYSDKMNARIVTALNDACLMRGLKMRVVPLEMDSRVKRKAFIEGLRPRDVAGLIMSNSDGLDEDQLKQLKELNIVCVKYLVPDPRLTPLKKWAIQQIEPISGIKSTDHSPDDKYRIVLKGLRQDTDISSLCAHENISTDVFDIWRSQFLEAAKSAFLGAFL